MNYKTILPSKILRKKQKTMKNLKKENNNVGRKQKQEKRRNHKR